MSQEQLNEWCEQYGIDKDRVIFGGHKHLGNGILGACSVSKICNIRVNHWFKNHDFWTHVVLWHEYNHAEAIQIDGYSGHGIPWLKRILRNPFLFLMQVPACFAYVIFELIE